jgi:SAM-dependent methyltransferase
MPATCNICNALCEDESSQLLRDVPSCPGCGSTARIRAVVYVLTEALFGRSMSLSELPERHDLTGIGLSDWGYVPGLLSKFSYRNTFFDRAPQLDITDPPGELYGAHDFLISSDVFEHVAPPAERAFDGAFQLLKPGGTFVLTVPYLFAGETMEHFPNLNEFEIFDFGGGQILVNRTVDKRWEVFDGLRFHGGEGAVLEMRIFSHDSVLQHLRAAGFEVITDWKDREPEFGPFWRQPHSFPIVARRPEGAASPYTGASTSAG